MGSSDSGRRARRLSPASLIGSWLVPLIFEPYFLPSFSRWFPRFFVLIGTCSFFKTFLPVPLLSWLYFWKSISIEILSLIRTFMVSVGGILNGIWLDFQTLVERNEVIINYRVSRVVFLFSFFLLRSFSMFGVTWKNQLLPVCMLWLASF